MRVNYNIPAMIANNALKTNDNKLSASTKKLSTGMKVAGAKDNPAGLAMSRRMNAQIKSLDRSTDNASDGISVIQTADGALSEVHDILQRMNELSIQAANGINSDSDLAIIQDEITELKDEITRISKATQFNGQNLLDGTFDYKGYATVYTDPDAIEDTRFTDPKITVNSYSSNIIGGEYVILQKDDEGKYTKGLTVDYNKRLSELDISDVTDPYVAIFKYDKTTGKIDDEPYIKDAKLSVDGDLLRMEDGSGRFVELYVTEALDNTKICVELTGEGPMTLQIGANEGQTLDAQIPPISLEYLGIRNVDFTRTVDKDIAANVDALTHLDEDELEKAKKTPSESSYTHPSTDVADKVLTELNNDLGLTTAEKNNLQAELNASISPSNPISSEYLLNKVKSVQSWDTMLDYRDYVTKYADTIHAAVKDRTYTAEDTTVTPPVEYKVEDEVIAKAEAIWLEWQELDEKLATSDTDRTEAMRKSEEANRDSKLEALWKDTYMVIPDRIDELETELDNDGQLLPSAEKIRLLANDYGLTERVQRQLDLTMDKLGSGMSAIRAGEQLYSTMVAAEKSKRIAPHTGADDAITDIGVAIQKVSAIRSRLGAYQNRLEHTVRANDVTSENMTAAYSRIMDVDMAEEMTVYSTQQVLSQAGTSMLAQANERPSQILQLLQ